MTDTHRWRPRLDLRLVHALRGVVRALKTLHPTRLDGAEHLPQGPALLVGNHGLLGYETPFFFESLYSHTGRVPLGLADRWFFRVPVLRDVLVRVGGMYGAPELAHAALSDGQLVVCYPGGAHEVLKRHPTERYTLRWDKCFGFVRVALRAGVPIVPFAAAGVDDTFEIVSRVRGSGRMLMGDDKYDLPVISGLPLPAPVPFWFRIGRPIYLEHPPHAEHDAPLVERLHRRVHDETRTMLADLLAQWRATYPGAARARRGEHAPHACSPLTMAVP